MCADGEEAGELAGVEMEGERRPPRWGRVEERGVAGCGAGCRFGACSLWEGKQWGGVGTGAVLGASWTPGVRGDVCAWAPEVVGGALWGVEFIHAFSPVVGTGR